MKDREYRLIITLKSDLCVGSGYSYAGIIDSDICYDALGLPYIPARRLKGCLREAAELMLRKLDGGTEEGQITKVVLHTSLTEGASIKKIGKLT